MFAAKRNPKRQESANSKAKGCGIFSVLRHPPHLADAALYFRLPHNQQHERSVTTIYTEVFDMPLLQNLLLTIFFLAFFVEIKTAGTGVGVILGLTAAGVFFAAQYMEGLVNLYQIGIFLTGVVFVAIELIMPTVGLLGIVGVAAMMYSVVLALGGDINALYSLLVSLVAALIIFAAIVKRLPSSRLWNKFVLTDKSSRDRGFVASDERRDLIGHVGKVLTELRPAGSALIDDTPIDVVSEGAYLEKGTAIKVIAVNGNRVVVRKL